MSVVQTSSCALPAQVMAAAILNPPHTGLNTKVGKDIEANSGVSQTQEVYTVTVTDEPVDHLVVPGTAERIEVK